MREGDQRARAGPEKEGRPLAGTALAPDTNDYTHLREIEKPAAPFRDHREAGRALIASGKLQTVKSAQFCGGLTVEARPLSPRQAEWLAKLLRQAGLPHIAEGGHA